MNWICDGTLTWLRFYASLDIEWVISETLRLNVFSIGYIWRVFADTQCSDDAGYETSRLRLSSWNGNKFCVRPFVWRPRHAWQWHTTVYSCNECCVTRVWDGSDGRKRHGVIFVRQRRSRVNDGWTWGWLRGLWSGSSPSAARTDSRYTVSLELMYIRPVVDMAANLPAVLHKIRRRGGWLWNRERR